MKLTNTNKKSYKRKRVNQVEQSSISSPSNPRCNSPFMRCNAVTSCKAAPSVASKCLANSSMRPQLTLSKVTMLMLLCSVLLNVGCYTAIHNWPGLLETTDLDVDITDPISDRWNPLNQTLLDDHIWYLLIPASSMGCGTQQLQETPISLRNSSR